MTVTPRRRAATVTPIPRPRDAEPDLTQAAEVAMDPAMDPAPELPPAAYPWPEPWRSARGARPRSEFWDHTTASWRSRGPVAPTQHD